MKKTALYDKHLALGAKMVPFAGYEMPVSYKGILEEHHAVRNQMGIFDVSHMGEFIVRGKEAEALLQWLTTNDVSKLNIGDVQYSCFPNGKGGIVDDLLVYRLPEDQCNEGEKAYMLVVNASNIEKDWNWIQSQNCYDVRLIDISEQTSLMAVQGPKTVEALQSLTDIDLSSMKYYSFQKGTFAGVANVIVSATGYTGAGGFEIYVENKDASLVWDAIMSVAENHGIQAAGLGCRDTLRLEMGYCLYGNDIDDSTSPIEAGLGWITKFKKGDFVDKAYLENQKNNGTEKKLVGFIVDDKRPARHGYSIVDENGLTIGTVSSGSSSPSLGYPVGMGYVQMSHAAVGTKIWIDIRGKQVEASVCTLPFLKK